MKIVICSAIIIAASAWQPAMANPLPVPTILEYSAVPPWLEVFQYTLLVGDTIRTLEGEAVVLDMTPNENGIIILDSTTTTGFVLNLEGDSIFFPGYPGYHLVLCYGQYGEPALPPLPGESVRAGIYPLNPGDPNSYWDIAYAFTQTPTPGFYDFSDYYIGGRWGSSALIINEVNAHGTWNDNAGFIELYNRDSWWWHAITTDNLTLIGNARYNLPPGLTIYPEHFFTIDQSDLPAGFLNSLADNLYLVDSDGEVVDQVGWSSDHGENVSFMRHPDGDVDVRNYHDFLGFNDSSSYTFENGYPSKGSTNRHGSPGFNVIGARAYALDSTTVLLQWTNPIWDSQFQYVKVARRSYPDTSNIIYEGTAEEFIDDIAPRHQAFYTVIAFNDQGGFSRANDESQVYISTLGECIYIPGDVNGNGSFNGIDVTYLVGFLKGGPAPPIVCNCDSIGELYVAADVNASCSVNGLDVIFLVVNLSGRSEMEPWPCPFCPPLHDLGGPSSEMDEK